MKIANVCRVSTLIVVLVALAGCKLLEDPAEERAARDSSTGSSHRDGNSPPSIWGDPDRTVLAQTQYYFVPEAEDPDGDVLEYEIVNKPEWAEFDRYSGSLRGVPVDDDVGRHNNVVVSVTDGNSVVSLPSFSIRVTSGSGDDGADDGDSGDDGSDRTNDDDPGASSPPTISGKPNTTAAVDNWYSFQPEASDPDGDELSFSIVNKPSWAKFTTTSGNLSGRPAYEDVGTSSPIEISVSDGTSIAALRTFTITVEATGSTSYTVAWLPPTENEDGSPLTDLAGYRIYYGTSAGDYSETIELGAGLTSYMIEDLTPGTYYLAMTSLNSQDVESRKTQELEFRPDR